MWSSPSLMTSDYGFREEDDGDDVSLSQKDRATLNRLKRGVSELRTDLELM